MESGMKSFSFDVRERNFTECKLAWELYAKLNMSNFAYRSLVGLIEKAEIVYFEISRVMQNVMDACVFDAIVLYQRFFLQIVIIPDEKFRKILWRDNVSIAQFISI